MKISIGNDHAGTNYKKIILSFLNEKGYEVVNYGTNSNDSVDYPDFAHKVGQDVDSGSSDIGIVICGSGNGVAMVANKHSKVRAAVCWITEMSILARKHNDANILSIPARFVSSSQALEIVSSFLETSFEGGRHQKRVDKI